MLFIKGIGADDAFIFIKLWNCSISERTESGDTPISNTTTTSAAHTANTLSSDTMAGYIGKTLKHASTSMLVSSLTTALAFYTSYLSAITAIRCFG